MEVLTNTSETNGIKELCNQTETALNLKSRIQRPNGSITWEFLVNIFFLVANPFRIDCSMIRNIESDRCGILLYARSATPL
jgi:hypothetical protein